jgi:hypothetical protein
MPPNTRWSGRGIRPPRRSAGAVCARHGTELVGCKSPRQGAAEAQARSRARARSRGGVARKPQPAGAGRRPGTGDEGWYTREEEAGDHEVLPPR